MTASENVSRRRADCFEEIALVDDTEKCICKPAVIRAYREMKGYGMAERVALDVAAKVLTHHHPEMPANRIRITVERWVHTGIFH